MDLATRRSAKDWKQTSGRCMRCTNEWSRYTTNHQLCSKSSVCTYVLVLWIEEVELAIPKGLQKDWKLGKKIDQGVVKRVV